jgi:hypothetical protein
MKIKKIAVIIDNLELPYWKILLLNEILNFTNLELISLMLIKNQNKKSISFMEKIIFKLESKRNIHGKSSIDRNNISFLTQKFPNIQIQEFSDLNLENTKNDEAIDQSEIDLFIYLGDEPLPSMPKLASEIWYMSFPYDYLPYTQFVGSSLINNEIEHVHSSLYSYSKHGHFKIIDIFSPVNSLSLKRMSNFHFWTCYLRILEQLEIFSKKPHIDFHKHLSEKNRKEIQDVQLVNLSTVFFKLLQNKFLRYDTSNLKEQWSLLYSFETNLSFDFKNFESITPSEDRFWADPFVVYRDKKYYIFFEEFLYEKNKGHISFMEIDKNGHYSKPKKILEKPYHLSYPHIFNFESSLFMIPESIGNNSIELYRCDDFPNKWTLEKILLKGNFVDSDIIFHDEKFWLLTGKKFENLPYVDHSELYYSDSLQDDWNYHSCNPVISNFECARNAGKIFSFNDKLIHPSQSYSKGYGSGINLNEITHISTQKFALKEFKKLETNWNDDYIGMHTINHSNGLTIIDAKKII